MTTVTAVKRAIVETMDHPDVNALEQTCRALSMIAASPTALTILANRLSDRGEAGNNAARANLKELRDLLDRGEMSQNEAAALEWAIDQLTPPEPAQGRTFVHEQELVEQSKSIDTIGRQFLIDEASFVPGRRTNAILGRNTGEPKGVGDTTIINPANRPDHIKGKR